ncbi:Perakine reductase [Camellia lanceoleosa]|uniref:Perakine reductase n=1 Tax=Camellia lanceoleosa TaxID=1840588 RepID=A0ACC0GUT4_9ERIC|nr:Perakine reductase [Camellia lanceoleosa]
MEDNNHIKIPRLKLGSQGLELHAFATLNPNLMSIVVLVLGMICKVFRLGFGCAGLSGIYNDPLSHEARCSIIKEAFSKGVTFFDTFDLYGQNYDNEIMVGKGLTQFPRAKAQLATKFGVAVLEDGQLDVKGTPEYVRQCCEASLKQLDLDYIVLYYQHRVDVSVPIEDTMGELKKLVEGKIKYIGLSEASAETVRRANAVHHITAVQVEYSLWTCDIEEDIIPLCRELGIGIVAYSPLGHGFFGEKGVAESMPTDSLLAHFPRYAGENLEKNKQLYARLANIAAKHNCTPPQLALAWLLHQENNVFPIPGTTKVNNLHSGIGSLALKFTEEDLKEISDAVPMDEVAGDRDLESLVKFSRKFANTPAKS